MTYHISIFNEALGPLRVIEALPSVEAAVAVVHDEWIIPQTVQDGLVSCWQLTSKVHGLVMKWKPPMMPISQSGYLVHLSQCHALGVSPTERYLLREIDWKLTERLYRLPQGRIGGITISPA